MHWDVEMNKKYLNKNNNVKLKGNIHVIFQLRTIFAESGVTKLRQPKTPQILQLNRLAYV